MAVCFPANIADIPVLDAPTVAFWELLRTLPDTWHAWISLSAHPNGHDFLLLPGTGQAVYVTHIISTTQAPVVINELCSLQRQFPDCTVVLASKSIGSFDIEENELRGIVFWGAQSLRDPKRLQRALDGLQAAGQTAAASMEALRRRIAPEVVIPARNARRISRNQNHTPIQQLAEYALDYQQEDLLKKDLILSEEGQRVAGAMHARLITGVAGCGKSLILLHRMKLLRELNANCDCLLTTFNKPLRSELEERYERLGSKKLTPVPQTFVAWCLGRLTTLGMSVDIEADVVSMDSKRSPTATVYDKYFAGSSISLEMMRDEFGWIKENLLFNQNEYLKSKRTGRGFALNESMRNKIFEAVMDYDKMLADANKHDWEDIPLLLLDRLNDGAQIHQYDAILVDEAQFFPPVAFKILQYALRPGGQLLLAADPTQGFLRSRLSWISMGVNVRGRSHVLTKCYRTTRSILEYAATLYQSRLPDEKEEIYLPGKAVLDAMEIGRPPLVEYFDKPQEETAHIIAVIKNLLAEGVPPTDILVVYGNGLKVKEFCAALENGVSALVHNLRDRGPRQQGIRVCSLDAATGLEAPIVFVAGIRDLFERENNTHKTDEERAALQESNTKRLYMACTRAMTRLYVFAPPDAVPAAAAYAAPDSPSIVEVDIVSDQELNQSHYTTSEFEPAQTQGLLSRLIKGVFGKQ